MTLAARGVPFPIELSLAEQVAEYLVALRLAIPYERWSMDPEDVERAMLDKLF